VSGVDKKPDFVFIILLLKSVAVETYYEIQEKGNQDEIRQPGSPGVPPWLGNC
jgi:hypothetical protein